MAGLPPWENIIRGTLMRYFLPCGKAGCRCHKARRYRHGPYWYVAVSYGKGRRQKMIMIPPGKRREVERGIRGYKSLWEKLCRISELNLELVKRG
jgi:hypothetical protein